MTARRRRSAGQGGSKVTLPGWTAERLVTCQDGPHAGTWWTLADWQARVTAARRMHVEHGERRQPSLDYVDAGRDVEHPQYGELGVTGAALVYRPQVARAAAPARSEGRAVA